MQPELQIKNQISSHAAYSLDMEIDNAFNHNIFVPL